MIYLSGAVDLPLLAMGRADVGVMANQNMGNVIPGGVVVGADNGCVKVVNGVPVPTPNWAATPWLRWLATLPIEDVLFAVAPDVVGDAWATWDRAKPFLPILRSLGFRAAYVAQDGLTVINEAPSVGPSWADFDALFIGGSTAYKLSEDAYRLAEQARQRGKWVHMGRVNSAARMFACAQQRFHSCDGTWLCYGPDANRPSLLTALNMAAALERTPSLFEDDSMGHELAGMVGA